MEVRVQKIEFIWLADADQILDEPIDQTLISASKVSVLSSPPVVPISGKQLSPFELAELAVARKAFRKIRRAIVVSSVNAWTIAIFGALTLVFGLFSLSGILGGLILGAVAFVEFRGRSGVRRLDAGAARMLAFNQIALGTFLVVYALWSLHAAGAATTVSALTSLGISDPQLRDLVGPTDSLVRELNEAIYGSVIAIGIGVQGMAALFYFRCERSIGAYLRNTPEWILRLQKAGVRI